jgi:uncharacterized protein YwqG
VELDRPRDGKLMPKRASILFVEGKDRPGVYLKFGGRPFGLPFSSWPRSKQTREPMQFIAQIPFGPDLFPSVTPSVAYVFMTNASDVDGTWLPDGGENAVVILRQKDLQDGFSDEDVSRLHRMVKRWWSKALLPQVCVFSAELKPGNDPEFVPMDKQDTWTESQRVDYWGALQGNKLGGSPGFLQADELPLRSRWHLLLQLDSAQVPFWINFGDAGIGYVFINEEGTEGRFLWQCC